MRLMTLITVSFLLLFSCGGSGSSSSASSDSKVTYAPNQQVYAYGLTHKDYLGFVRLRTDAQGQISDVYIDDLFFPTHWAVLTADQAANLESVQVEGRHGPEYMAKYIGVGNRFYMAEVAADGKSAKYLEVNADGTAKSGGIADIKAYSIANQAQGKEYFDLAMENKFSVMKMEGGKLVVDEAAFKASPMNLIKGNSGYWSSTPVVNKSLGFRSNIRYLANYLLLHGFNFDVNKDVVRNADNGQISIMDAATGATIADWKDYLTLAQSAESMLKK